MLVLVGVVQIDHLVIGLGCPRRKVAFFMGIGEHCDGDDRKGCQGDPGGEIDPQMRQDHECSRRQRGEAQECHDQAKEEFSAFEWVGLFVCVGVNHVRGSCAL